MSMWLAQCGCSKIVKSDELLHYEHEGIHLKACSYECLARLMAMNEATQMKGVRIQ